MLQNKISPVLQMLGASSSASIQATQDIINIEVDLAGVSAMHI